MKKSFLIIFLFFLHINTFAEVFVTETGKIEFVGLENWEAKDLIDSISGLNPNGRFHPCAATLKSELGFADASVLMYMDENKKFYTVVKVVESNRIDKIHYKNVCDYKLPVIEKFKNIEPLLGERNRDFDSALRTYKYHTEAKPDSAKNIIEWMGTESKNVEKIWKFIEEHNTIEDYELAKWILNNDGNLVNQKCALLILMNFSEFDATWWTLLDLLRSDNHRIESAASHILQYFYKSCKRQIDWSPAINSVEYLLNGTNLFAYDHVLIVLTKTSVNKDLLAELLPDVKELLISHLLLEHTKAKEAVKLFLHYYYGGNFSEKDYVSRLKNL